MSDQQCRLVGVFSLGEGKRRRAAENGKKHLIRLLLACLICFASQRDQTTKKKSEHFFSLNVFITVKRHVLTAAPFFSTFYTCKGSLKKNTDRDRAYLPSFCQRYHLHFPPVQMNPRGYKVKVAGYFTPAERDHCGTELRSASHVCKEHGRLAPVRDPRGTQRCGPENGSGSKR